VSRHFAITSTLHSKPSFPFVIRYKTRTTVSYGRWSQTLPEMTVRSPRRNSESLLSNCIREPTKLDGDHCTQFTPVFPQECNRMIAVSWPSVFLRKPPSLWMVDVACRYKIPLHNTCRESGNRLAKSSKTPETISAILKSLHDFNPYLCGDRGGNKYDHNLLSCARQGD
jgi:hypothetical protein